MQMKQERWPTAAYILINVNFFCENQVQNIYPLNWLHKTILQLSHLFQIS